MKKVCFFAVLLLLPAVVNASGEAAQHKPLPTEALEKYDNPPAAFWGTGFSPRMVAQEGVFISFQVNVNASGQNIVGDAANEPSIAVDPTNPSKITIGWRQFNSVTSNFRQSGYGYTTNGGLTWTFPGVLENNVFRSDPVLDSDDTGHFFYLSLLQTFFDNMWRSLNGGQTWTNLGPANGGDKQWFKIDNTTSTGHGFQHQIWSTGGNNYGGRQFSRSTDGGVTWMSPIFIPNSPAWGTPDVDSNGRLFIGGVNLNTGQIWCIRSSNANNSAVTPTFDQSTAVNLGGDIDASDTINPGGLIGQIFLTVDRSGTGTNNYVYMMASLQPTGFGTGSDVMFVRSTDGGQTFSAPKRVNDDPINHSKWHWFGTLSVAPNGRIDSVWLDTRNAANNTDSQLFYSYSTDAGNTWSPSVSVSPAFNPFLGYPNQNKMGDYMTIVSDNTGGDVAYTATFNQEEDIYYVRVAPPIGTPTPTPTGTPVPTPTATATPTATPSATPTATATATPTATATATSTSTPTATPVGTPTATATPTATPVATPTGTPTATPTATPISTSGTTQALNISTRLRVETGNNVAIGGFIVTGNTPKKVVVRGLGPSLSVFGLTDFLADPTLELRAADGTVILSDDNWQDDPVQAAQLTALGLAPSDAKESALVVTLQPGASYTAILAGKNGGAGVGLVEIYDADSGQASQLGNISTRGFVRTGSNVMIGGFILGGNSASTRVAVRGLGPSLSQSGLTNVLADPTLELRNSNGALLISNDNWQDDPVSAAQLTANGLALTDTHESGIFTTLAPGAYTAILAGKNGGIGLGLVEVYNVH